MSLSCKVQGGREIPLVWSNKKYMFSILFKVKKIISRGDNNNVKIILQRWMGSGSGGSELNLHLSLHYVIGNVKEEI